MKINQVTSNIQNITPQANRPAPSSNESDAHVPVEAAKYVEPVKYVEPAKAGDRVDKSDKSGATKTEKDPDEIMKKSVEQANKTLKQYNRYIERSVHEVTHAIMYQIKDTNTNEVIQEFPPRKIQDMIAKMWELAGLFVDEKA